MMHTSSWWIKSSWWWWSRSTTKINWFGWNWIHKTTVFFHDVFFLFHGNWLANLIDEIDVSLSTNEFWKRMVCFYVNQLGLETDGLFLCQPTRFGKRMFIIFSSFTHPCHTKQAIHLPCDHDRYRIDSNIIVLTCILYITYYHGGSVDTVALLCVRYHVGFMLLT